MGVLDWIADPTKVLEIEVPIKNTVINALKLLGHDTGQIERISKSLDTTGNIAGSLLSPITGVFLFSAFIMEEALQAAGFAYFQAIRINDEVSARKALEAFEGILQVAEDYFVDVLEDVPPVNMVFAAYLSAARVQKEQMRARLSGAPAAGQPAGINIFDRRE